MALPAPAILWPHEFESHANHLHFLQFILMKPKMLFLFNKISEKVAEIGPIKNKNNNNWLKRVQPNQMQANVSSQLSAL